MDITDITHRNSLSSARFSASQTYRLGGHHQGFTGTLRAILQNEKCGGCADRQDFENTAFGLGGIGRRLALRCRARTVGRYAVL